MICQVNDALKTLNLKLDEVAHIRSVLTRAQLDGLPIDGNIRENVERGKVATKKTMTIELFLLLNHSLYICG